MKNPKILLIPAVVLAVAIGGCSSPQNAEDSSANETNTEQVSGNNDAGEASSSADAIKEEELEGALVESFPEDKAPLYPGTVTKSVGGMADYLQKPEWAVNITTTDAFSDVDSSIRNSYNSDGWSIRSDNKTALGGSLLVAHSDDYIISINYEDKGDSGIKIHYGLSAK